MFQFYLIMVFAIMFSGCSPTPLCTYQDRIYLDEKEVDFTNSSTFHIHKGQNQWIETHTIKRDKTGMYTFEDCIKKLERCGRFMEYEKLWKCPYCFQYWPIGKACQNEDCPSKYR